jgi:hypothetical protein
MNLDFLDKLGGHTGPISVTIPVNEQASLPPTNIMVSPPRPPKPALPTNGSKK